MVLVFVALSWLILVPTEANKHELKTSPLSISSEGGGRCFAGWRTCGCGELLYGCTTEHAYDNRPWCATEVDPVSRVFTSWDWCARMDNCTCPTASRKPCQQFQYNGATYPAGTCTFADTTNGRPWCATEGGDNVGLLGPSHGNNSNWDYCNENCELTAEIYGEDQCIQCPVCAASYKGLMFIDMNGRTRVISDTCPQTKPLPSGLQLPGIADFVGGHPFVCPNHNNGVCYAYSFTLGTWVNVANFPASNVYIRQTVKFGADKLWVFERVKTSYIYTPGQGFAPGPTLPSSFEYDPTACWINDDQLFFVGPLTIQNWSRGAAYVYEISTNTWTQLPTLDLVGEREILEPSCGRVIRSDGSLEIVVFRGNIYTDVYIFNFDTNTWRLGRGRLPAGTWYSPVVPHGNTILGHSFVGSGNPLPDVYIYDPDTESWSRYLTGLAAKTVMFAIPECDPNLGRCIGCPEATANFNGLMLIGMSGRTAVFGNNCPQPKPLPSSPLQLPGLGDFLGGHPFVCPQHNGACFAYSFAFGTWVHVGNLPGATTYIRKTVRYGSDSFLIFVKDQSSYIYTPGQGFASGPRLPTNFFDLDPTACWINDDEIFFIGGVGRISPNVEEWERAEAFLYQISTDSWTQLPTLNIDHVISDVKEPTCGRVLRDDGSMEIYVIKGNAAFTGAFIFSFATYTWRRAGSELPGGTWHTSVVPHGRTIVSHSFMANGGILPNIYIYDPEAETWSTYLVGFPEKSLLFAIPDCD